MKYWTKEWKVPVVFKKVSKSKQQVESRTSQKSNSPTRNIRKTRQRVKETRGIATVRKIRKKNPIPKPSMPKKDRA